ncbi:MAG: hypothetical protein K8U03_05280 [Planctomycetia bacterium]|nr:hypothetical protein [Planctomycetia bacterium]
MTTPQELQAKLTLGIEKARTNSRRLVYIGAGLIVLSFVMSWWGLKKERVYEQQGVSVADAAAQEAITANMTAEDKKDYDSRIAQYSVAWQANQSLNRDYYLAAFGQDYDQRLRNLENVSLRSGSMSLFGWSTGTGWFGVLFVIAGAAWFAAPKFKPELEDFAWTIPWVWTALGAIYLIAVLAFYFNAPDVNGAGYSQGVALGCYLSIFGTLAVVVGGTFEGIKSANERLAAIAAEAEDEEVDEEPADDASGAPRRPPLPKPSQPINEVLDAEAAKRKRLTDW